MVVKTEIELELDLEVGMTEMQRCEVFQDRCEGRQGA